MFKFSALAALVAILPAFVEAQSQLYAQCGGIGWSKSPVAAPSDLPLTCTAGGATTCVSGATCTVLNDYYSQCLFVVISSHGVLI